MTVDELSAVGRVPADDEPVVDLAETAVEAVSGETGDFGRFLRAAGKLAVARQVSALLLVAVVFALPALTSRRVATDFVWGYFAVLTLSSLLGLGLERLAGAVVGDRGSRTAARAVAPVLGLRLVTLPLGALGMVVLFAFVGVDLPTAAWAATFVWLAAAMVAPVVFGAIRVTGRSTAEPVTMVAVRAGQAAALLGLAVAGAPLAALLGVAAVTECAAVVAGLAVLGDLRTTRGAWLRWGRLPVREGMSLAGVDVLGVLNLRVDLLMVGHILGAAPGATYGLLYRAVDAFSGMLSSAGLWLFAESAGGRDGGVAPVGIRARSLRLLPALGLVAATVLVLGAGLVGAVVPRVGPETTTLRILAIAFPILCVNAVEVHVRTGRGRAAEILRIYAVMLVVNVPLCIAAIHAFGLRGAAGTLVVTELLQSALLWSSADRDERGLVGRAMALAIGGAAVLTLVVTAMAAVGW